MYYVYRVKAIMIMIADKLQTKMHLEIEGTIVP